MIGPSTDAPGPRSDEESSLKHQTGIPEPVHFIGSPA